MFELYDVMEMTLKLLFGDEIRSHVLKILSGECLYTRQPSSKVLYILSPWISDVEIEFSDLYLLREHRKLRESKGGDFLFLDYNIKSINLPYALLLLKLHSGAEVNVVTLPLEAMNLSPDSLPKIETLLDFLDEIGCNIFVNPKLHSKLLLANDLALLGSFNLSSSALYYREEIGVSINDLDNLEKLESYCWDVIRQSKRYGYSSLLRYGKLDDRKYETRPEWHTGMSEKEYITLLKQWDKSKDAHILRQRWLSRRNQITRGWLLDELIKRVYHDTCGEFFDVTGGYDRFVKSYARSLEVFYLLSIRRLISMNEDWRTVKGKDWIKGFFDYDGDESIDSIMEFVNNKFARKTMPNIRLRIKSLE